MSIKKTYIPAKPRSSKLVGTSMSGGVAGSVSSSSADPNAHSHSNKVVLDKLTDGDIDVLGKLSVDEDGNIKVDTTLWATGGISALGLGEGGGPGTGGDFDRLDKWEDYNSTKANWVLSALLGYDLHTRVNSLEAGGGSSNIDIAIDGSGNAVTGVSKSGNTLTFEKSSIFSLSTHTHTIAQITGLQGALDSKATQSDISTAIDGVEIGGRNLIIGSYNDWRSKGIGQYGTQLDFIPIQDDWRGKTVTHSFEVKDIPDGERVQIRIDFHTTGASYIPYGLGSSVVSSGKSKITYEVPSLESGYIYIGARIYSVNYTSEYNVLFRSEKLEFGTKATDWTPAPEDVDAKITLVQTNLNNHTSNSVTDVKHLTDAQLAYLNDLIGWWKVDASGNLYTEKNLYSTKGVSALGVGDDGGGVEGGADMLQSWETYTSDKANYYVPASLLVSFRDDTLIRLTSLEAGSATSVSVTGTGDVIVGGSKSGNVITLTRGNQSWDNLSGKPATFAPSAHSHNASDINDGTLALARIPTGTSDTTVALGNHLHIGVYEPVFTKNEAFNKNFGTASGTVAQGNDSRILNGQTAFEWGNHSSFGYALNTALTAHTENSTIHITSDERTNWNDANSKKHTHSNKALLDLITQSNIDVLNLLSVVDGNIKVDTTLWATGGISALGLGEGGGSGGGGVDMLDSWANYTTAKANYYAPASLLVPFRSDTLSRLTSLESGSATSIVTTGTGNAITSLTKSGSVITATKGLTFALSSHTHTIAQITGLQGALDLKATPSDIDTAIDGIEIGGRNLVREVDIMSLGSNASKGIDDFGQYIRFSATNPTSPRFPHIKYEDNTQYTLSIEASVETGVHFYWYFVYTDGSNSGMYSTIIINTATPVIRRATSAIDKTIDYIAYTWELSGYRRMYNFKLEKGTVATDWTPAPEDQITDWNVADVNSFAFLKNKPTQLSQFTDNIGVATHIANTSNPHNVTKSQVGLSNVDNTSDLLKPISNAVQTALNAKLNLTGGTLGNTAKLEIVNNSVGIPNVLQLTNTSSVGRQGTSIFFKGYFNQALISSSQNPASTEGGDLHLQTYSNNSVLNTGIYLDRTGNVGINTINPSYNLDVAGTGRFTGNVIASTGINTPKVDFGNGFTIEPSGTELVFKYNGVIKQRMLSDGTILATGGITALTTT